MCHNIIENKISRKEEFKKRGKTIKEWIEDRPNLASKNVKAIQKRIRNLNSIDYNKKFPLQLNDGTYIFKISSRKIDSEYNEISVAYSIKESKRVGIIKFKRRADDELEEIEEFFSNCQSIYQNRNIDLNYA